MLSHKLDQGIDVGVLIYLNNFIVGVKYDNARDQVRYLVGWSI